MSTELKVIVPDIKATFGKLVFAGKGKEVFTFDPITRQRTGILEARIYKLTSDVQGGQIEVYVPAVVKDLEFNFMEEVEIINPVLTARGTSTKESSFASVIWKCEVDDIIKKETGAMPKNTGTNKSAS